MVRLLIIILTYVDIIAHIMAQWTIASENFSREHLEMAVGEYNGTIYLVGDWAYPKQVSKYDIATNTLTTSLDALTTQFAGGNGQYWSQQGSILYIIQPSSSFGAPPLNSPLAIYNMATEQLTANWRGIETPEFIGDTACLSSTPQNVYIMGGGDAYDIDYPNQWSSALQILSLSSYEWENNPNPPSMKQERGGISCIIANEYLWVFGGFTGSMVYDSNERIHIVDIAQNAWQYVERLTLSLRSTRAVSMGDNIYIIGGVTSIDGLSGKVDIVHIMNTKSAIISVSPDIMPFDCVASAPIVVNSILYAFGGMHASDGYPTAQWAYYNLPIISSSSNPTISTSSDPTISPSNVPTRSPSDLPTYLPSNVPTHLPSYLPTDLPSINPLNASTDPITTSNTNRNITNLTTYPSMPSVNLATLSPTETTTLHATANNDSVSLFTSFAILLPAINVISTSINNTNIEFTSDKKPHVNGNMPLIAYVFIGLSTVIFSAICCSLSYVCFVRFWRKKNKMELNRVNIEQEANIAHQERVQSDLNLNNNEVELHGNTILNDNDEGQQSPVDTRAEGQSNDVLNVHVIMKGSAKMTKRQDVNNETK